MDNNLEVKSTTKVFNLKDDGECMEFINKYMYPSSVLKGLAYDLFKEFDLSKIIPFKKIEEVCEALDQCNSSSVKVVCVEGLKEPAFFFNFRGVKVGNKMFNALVTYTCYDDEPNMNINRLVYEGVNNNGEDTDIEPGFDELAQIILSYGDLNIYALRCGEK